MRTIKLTIAATDTHCGKRGTSAQLRCQYAAPLLAGWPSVCSAFPSRELNYDSGSSEFFRLPECIAAEKEAGK